MSRRRGLKAVTLTPGSGYGDAACQYLAGLDALGIALTWTPVTDRDTAAGRVASLAGVDDSIRERVARLWQRSIEYDTLLLDVPPHTRHERWLEIEPQARPFAYVAHEVDRLPEHWAPVLNRFERVFVPSEFNRRTFVDGGVAVPVDVVPHVARRTVPVIGSTNWGAIDDEDFVFYTIGEWTARKALAETVRAYLDAFAASEKVALVIKTDPLDWIRWSALGKQAQSAPPHAATTWWSLARIIAAYDRPAKVHLIADTLSPREIDGLHSRGDCFVSLTCAEGWGLVPFDALLFGNPAIVTGWGGQLDYLGDDYPLSVRYDIVPTLDTPADGHHLRSPLAHWARADRAHAGALMRSVFEKRASARALAADMGARLRQRFAPPVVCARLAALMGLAAAP